MYFRLLLIIFLIPFYTFGQEVITSGDALYRTTFSLINGSIMEATIKNSKTSKSKTSKPKAKIKDLTFERSEELSKEIQKDFIASMIRIQPELKGSLVKSFENNKLRNQFDRLLAGYNYSATDMADVVTAYLVISWQIVHNKNFDDKNGFNAVRTWVRDILLKSEQLAVMDNATKQLYAEAYGYQTMLCFNSYKTLIAKSDQKGLDHLRNNLYKSVKDSFIDLKSVKLTHTGFVKI